MPLAEGIYADHGFHAAKESDIYCADPPKRNRGNQPEGLPRIEQVIKLDSLDCPFGCGEMHRIGEDRNERVDIAPAQLRVIVTIRPK